MAVHSALWALKRWPLLPTSFGMRFEIRSVETHRFLIINAWIIYSIIKDKISTES